MSEYSWSADHLTDDGLALGSLPRLMSRRENLAQLPTPLQPASRLSEALGREIWIKRDDLTGLSVGGGNKARKLELLTADARARGADTLIAIGAPQSNYARSVAAAAAALGMRSELALGGPRPLRPSGSLILDELFGARMHFRPTHSWDDLAEFGREVSEEVERRGGKPYVMPVGGSTALGVISYVAAYFEFRRQAIDRGLRPRTLIHASSSGGTQAGLELGRGLAGDRQLTVVGVDVACIFPSLQDSVAELAVQAAETLGVVPPDISPVVLDRYLGGGYALPSEEVRQAIRLMATTEGIVADPVYSGKALQALCLENLEEPIVFWHTGGAPAILSDELGMVAWPPSPEEPHPSTTIRACYDEDERLLVMTLESTETDLGQFERIDARTEARVHDGALLELCVSGPKESATRSLRIATNLYGLNFDAILAASELARAVSGRTAVVDALPTACGQTLVEPPRLDEIVDQLTSR